MQCSGTKICKKIHRIFYSQLKRSIGDSDSDLGIGSSASSTLSGGASRKTWTTTRRSFFKRKKGGRSSSRDSSAAKELASFSDMASLNYSDSGALHEVEPQINSYVRVEKLDCKYRPGQANL